MDARRFDALARALTTGASRRRLLQVLPGLAVGGLLPRAVAARAVDAGDAVGCPTPVGGRGCTGGADCAVGEICVDGLCQAAAGAGAPPTNTVATTQGEEATAVPGDGVGTGQEATATPRAIESPTARATAVAAQISPNQALAAQLHEGVCGSLDATPAFPLIDIGAADGDATPAATDQPVGAATALPARFSTTVIDANLADLLAAPYAIDVRLTADDPATSVACGDIGALPGVERPENELAIGLAGRGGSGYGGIAWLRDEGERTVVYVFVAQGLGGTGGAAAAEVSEETAAETGDAPAFAAGISVVVTEDVNLRAAPSSEADVVGALPQGTELTVTAAPVDGWVPVRDPATGRPGYVNGDFVVLAE